MSKFTSLGSTNIWKKRPVNFLIVCCLLLFPMACTGYSAEEMTTQPGAEVIITSMAAEIIGELVYENGCVRIRGKPDSPGYTLLWPPDFSITIEENTLRVKSGIVTKKPQEVILHFGDIVSAGGGITKYPNEELLKKLPSHCKGPYWVVGISINPVQATKEP